MEQGSIIPVEEYKKNFKKNKKTKREEKVQTMFCQYVKVKYPNVIFNCDIASGLKLPIWLGVLYAKMRSSRGLPDFNAAEPKNNFKGFYLEIKKDNSVVFLQKGGLSSDKHIQEQEAVLQRLRDKGYYAQFGIGLTDCIEQFDKYMSL